MNCFTVPVFDTAELMAANNRIRRDIQYVEQTEGDGGSTSSTAGCRVAVVSPNDNAVSATAGALLLPQTTMRVRETPGQRVSAISNDAGTMSLSITELTK